MQVAFRVDASPAMGLGHLKRCLALARALDERGCGVRFVTRDLGIDSAARIAAAGLAVAPLAAPAVDEAREAARGRAPHAAWAGVPQARDAEQTIAALGDAPVDWVAVDHYALDRDWHRRVAAGTGARICVIDDLADRPLDGDMLVDHNPAPDHRAKFAPALDGPDGRPQLLGGLRYALLAPAYAAATPYAFRPTVRSIGIFMGGTDAARATEVALRACREVAHFDGQIEVVATSANAHLDALQALCARSGETRLQVDLPDLAAFFARHDLQIGAGGGAAWERCRIGAPTLTLHCADNQRVVLEALAAAGAARTAEATSEAIGRAVRELIDDAPARRMLCERSRVLVDGRGAERVALALCADTVTLRPAAVEDAAMAYVWRNHERTRRYSRDPSPLVWEEHAGWWSRALRDDRRHLLMACIGPQAVGSMRLDVAGTAAEISLYLDPELAGLRLGRALLQAAQRWVRAQAPSILRIDAEVHPDNAASCKAFAAAGFERVGASAWAWAAAS